MGHGIFPNYGMQFIKSWQHLLSQKDRVAVYDNRHKKKFVDKAKEEEAETPIKKH